MNKTFSAIGSTKAASGIALFSIVLFAAIGYAAYLRETRSIRQSRHAELHAISRMKAESLAAWRQERLGDAAFLVSTLKRLAGLRLAGNGPSSRPELSARLKRFQETYSYQHVFLVSLDGRVLESAKPGPSRLDPVALALTRRSASAKSAVMGDLFRCPDCGLVHLDVAAPVLGPEGRPIASVLLRTAPGQYLYPLIQSWPAPSRTAETLLVRRDGDEALFLNRLRHRPDPELTLRVPLAEGDIPAVLGILGKKGLHEGLDYRGVRVLSDIHPIPDSTWVMVSKMDASELYTELRYRSIVILLLVLFAILLACGLAVLTHAVRQARLYANLDRTQTERDQARDETRAALYGIGDGVISVDKQGRVTRLNPEAERLTGWPEAEAQGRPIDEIFRIVNEESGLPASTPIDKVMAEGRVLSLANHTELISRDGTRRPIADSGAPIKGPSGEIIGAVLIFRDQTKERQQQKALEDSAARYRQFAGLTSDFIYSCVRKDGGHYRLDWVGGALEKLCGRTDAELMSMGCWLKLVHPDDFQAAMTRAHTLAPGEEASQEFRILTKSGEVRHVSNIVHCVREAGSPDRLRLLGSFRDITARKEEEDKFRHAFEMSGVPKSLTLPNGTVNPNPALCSLLGYTHEELRAMNWRDITPKEDIPHTETAIADLVSGAKDHAHFEKRYRRKDDSIIHADVNASAKRDAMGRLQYFITSVLDITDRKRAERDLREQEVRFHELFENSGSCVAVYRPVQDGQDFEFVAVNKTLEAVERTRRDDILGRRVTEVFPGVERLGLLEVFRRVSATGKPERLPAAKYEDPRIAGWRENFVYRLPDGEIVAVYADLTAEMETRERFRLLFEANTDAMMLLDEKGFFDCNAACLSLFGCGEKSEFCSRHPADLSPDRQPCGRESRTLAGAMISAALERGRMSFEWSHRRLDDDSVFPAEVLLSRMVLGGKPALQATVRDITARKMTEAALRESETRFRTLVEGISSEYIFYRHDAAGVFTYLSPSVQQILGYSAEEFSTHYSTYLTDDPINAEVSKRTGLCLQGVQQPPYEVRTRHKDGSLRILEIFESPARGPDGSVIGVDGIAHDVTERRLAQTALTESEQRLRAVTDSAQDAILMMGHDGRISFWNPAAEKIFGYTAEESLGRDLHNLLAPERYHEAHHKAFPAFQATGQGGCVDKTVELEGIRKGGTEISIALSLSAVKLKGRWQAVGIARDITELKKADRNRARLAAIVESSSDAIVGADQDGLITSWNLGAQALFGYAENEALGASLEMLAKDPEEIRRSLLLAREGARHYESTRYAKDGRAIEVSVAASPIHDDTGRLAGFSAIYHDITGRKQAEQRLSTLSRALDQSPTIVVITDAKGGIEFVNPRFTEVTGYSFDEAVGRNPRFLKSGETPPEEYRRLWEAIMAGGVWKGELHNKRKDGTLYWERASISAVRDASGALIGFLGIKEDITAHKEMREELRQAQKMESIGRLAGGVAHDFNNLLTAIKGYAELLRDSIPKADPRSDDVLEVLSATDRASALTRQLLAFSRRQVLSPQILDLNAAVADVSKMLRRLIGENIRLETRLADAPCMVKVDAGQLDQVLLNLAVNSRDAMPTGGILTITSEVVTPSPEFFRDRTGLQPGPMAVLSVSDTGTGMNEEVRRHAFEPFFTTKERGKGTGLGLATVYGIIKQSGGDIVLRSLPGQGTTFLIYLPQVSSAQDATEKEKEKEKEKEAGPSRHETVLFVEDEEVLRRLGERSLATHGYSVLTAANGAEAIALLKSRGRPVDLLVTDVVMPGMNGRELAKKVWAMKLCRRTLYISGYTDDAVGLHGILEEDLAFLGKPFNPTGLLRKVREVLDGPEDKAKA
ncbi:MAG: PAS domain S-box protein [Elusimicrobiota bacterium]|jgi:PAS domain S-box-containing protein